MTDHTFRSSYLSIWGFLCKPDVPNGLTGDDSAPVALRCRCISYIYQHLIMLSGLTYMTGSLNSRLETMECCVLWGIDPITRWDSFFNQFFSLSMTETKIHETMPCSFRHTCGLYFCDRKNRLHTWSDHYRNLLRMTRGRLLPKLRNPDQCIHLWPVLQSCLRGPNRCLDTRELDREGGSLDANWAFCNQKIYLEKKLGAGASRFPSFRATFLRGYLSYITW